MECVCVCFTAPDKRPSSGKAARSAGNEKVGSETAETALQKAKRKSEVVVEEEKEALKPKKQKVEEPEEAIGKRRRAPSAKVKAAITGAASSKSEAADLAITKSEAPKDNNELVKQEQPGVRQTAPRAPRKSSIYRLASSLVIISVSWLASSLISFHTN